MKTLKKIGALALVAVMLLVLSVNVFATDTAGDKYTGDSKTTIDGNKIPITKSIVFFNKNGSEVYEPNITYTYDVTPVTGLDGVKVTDKDGNVATVNSGVANGVTGTSIAFNASNTAVAAAATGTEVEKTANLTVNIDASTYPHAGIYRYLVTEKVGTDTTAGVAAQGIERGTGYVDTRYLDVYIGNDNDTNGLKLVGAVFFKTAKTATGETAGTDDIGTNTEKTTGFEPGNNTDTGGKIDYTNDQTVDRYTTYDFTISKTVTGTMGDKTHDFPFYVNVTNTIAGAKYTYTNDADYAAAETVTGTSITKGSDDKNSDLKLKDSESIKLVGVPSNTTDPLSVTVKEYNDTVDQYTATVKANVDGTANKALATNPSNGVMDASTGSAALAAAFDIKTNDVADQVIAFTNNLSEISPTGIVLRVAPYVILLAAGLTILALTRRQRREIED